MVDDQRFAAIAREVSASRLAGVERIGAAREGFESALREMAARVEPRGDHGLIHGELGPDHVLVDERDTPVLIDIEGTMFFDVEWEHVSCGSGSASIMSGCGWMGSTSDG
ncbi:phosphotransferase [Nonomuraea sp. NPDC049784]|uniref:phosphotransferase n=1 Tax=Nonomuraea sp. NPDC049784 TaxID=3154361 RepID=UPI003410E0DB